MFDTTSQTREGWYKIEVIVDNLCSWQGVVGIPTYLTTVFNVKSNICSLMRDAEKLMSRCIYLNILKATISAARDNETSSETLEK